MSTTAIICVIVAAFVIAATILFFRKSDRSVMLPLFGGMTEEKKRQMRVEVTECYENGEAIKTICEYINNIKDGEERLFYPNGQLNRVRHWNSGILDGEMLIYYPNGKCYITARYKKGKLKGNYVVYNQKGVVIRTIKY